MKEKVRNRFIDLVSYGTGSKFDSGSVPSTQEQLAFARRLAGECEKIGLSEVRLSKHGYVYAVLPSNIGDDIPVIGFIAHMDTSPDFCGEGITPRIIRDYDGGDIKLGGGRTLSPEVFGMLSRYKGQELIVTGGNTLLGADDKAGIAEILTAMEYMAADPSVRHGKIAVAFTPDEEIGRGADHFDVNGFGADFAFTVDAGEIGELEAESFNAARVKITVRGKSVHPGYAKDFMVNAADIAAAIASEFPADQKPGNTCGREGFFHLCGFSGGVEQAKIDFIVRDFETVGFNRRKDFIIDLVRKYNEKHGGGTVTLHIRDEYYNMHGILKERPEIIAIAEKACIACGVAPSIKPIRGGTDGSRLTFMGLPCPNIFTGGHNFHGPYEFIPVESMVKAAEVIVKIASHFGNGMV